MWRKTEYLKNLVKIWLKILGRIEEILVAPVEKAVLKADLLLSYNDCKLFGFEMKHSHQEKEKMVIWGGQGSRVSSSRR